MNPVAYHVVCVCGGSGFPFGPGDAPRIINVGKALQAAGVKFRVLHCGPSPIADNRIAVGEYEGIPFEYTTRTTKRPSNRILRLALYAWGISVLAIRLLSLRSRRQHSSVYIFHHAGVIGLITVTLSRLLRIPVVQEVNEWVPATPTCSLLTRWLYTGPMFSLAAGTLVISSAIEQRVRAIARRLRRPPIVLKTPILVDVTRFQWREPAPTRVAAAVPQFVWCGNVAESDKDVDYMIRALGYVLQRGIKCELVLVGSAPQGVSRRIVRYAETQGAAGAVVMKGFVDDSELNALYHSAAALLLPLYDDDHSRTRMPTKLGGYLASGTPVITCDVGDSAYYLSHGSTAYMGAAGDEMAFAANMCAVLRDPVTARAIGAAGQKVCEAEIDYKVHSARLANFFVACIQSVYH